MRVLMLLIISITLYSCNDHKSSESLRDHKVEIINNDGKTDLDIFYEGEFFDNDEARNLNNEGIKLIKESKYKEAEEYFIAAYRIEPENPTILTNLGNIYSKIGTQRMAIEYYQEALIASDSNYLGAGVNMGISYLNMEEYENSEYILNYVSSKLNHEIMITTARLTLVEVYAKQQECQNAKDLYRKIEPLLNKHPDFKGSKEKVKDMISLCKNISTSSNHTDKMHSNLQFPISPLPPLSHLVLFSMFEKL